MDAAREAALFLAWKQAQNAAEQVAAECSRNRFDGTRYPKNRTAWKTLRAELNEALDNLEAILNG